MVISDRKLMKTLLYYVGSKMIHFALIY